MTRHVVINGRRIGAGEPAYVIAEMSANHGHDFDVARQIIDAAKAAGADAVKMQTYTADTMTIDCDNEHFRISGTLWNDRYLHELYREAYTPWDWQPKLKEHADSIGIDLFSSPFDATAVDFLEDMGVPAYKIASFEIVDIPLIQRVAATGKPMILSTGMASLAEIEEAVQTIARCEGPAPILLKCTSAYPAPPNAMNLMTIPHLAAAFDVPVGLSDHTMGSAVAIAGVALGASVIEKHFTLARSDGGPDSAFSMEPAEFEAMVAAVRMAEQSLGQVHYGADRVEESSLAFRRSLFVVRDLKTGDRFTSENIRSIRPGFGLHTRHLGDVIGRTATRSIARGTPLGWDLVGGAES